MQSDDSADADLSQEPVLVGFGKHDLVDMITWAGTDKEKDLLLAPSKWPARWRRLEICDEAELQAMKSYIEFTTDKLNQSVIGGL